MHPEDIKAAIRKRGYTQTSIAERCDVSKQTVCMVINGRSISARVANAIAKAAGHSITSLWPDKYPKKNSARQPAQRAI